MNNNSITPLINGNPRDSNILFEEETHTYTLIDNGANPISVTTLIHKYFPEFDADVIINKMMRSTKWPKSKYYGRTCESIKEEWKKSGEEASKSGTLMHKNIEDYINNIIMCEGNNNTNSNGSKEFAMFIKFWEDLIKKYPSLRPYRTEWIVYDEDIGVAGSIDCLLTDDKDNLVIIDWKRSKEIKKENRFEKGKFPFETLDNCNYSHYSLQLNFYRHILETKYGKNIIFMMLVVLHPNQSSYICHPIPKIELSHVWPILSK